MRVSVRCHGVDRGTNDKMADCILTCSHGELDVAGEQYAKAKKKRGALHGPDVRRHKTIKHKDHNHVLAQRITNGPKRNTWVKRPTWVARRKARTGDDTKYNKPGGKGAKKHYDRECDRAQNDDQLG